MSEEVQGFKSFGCMIQTWTKPINFEQDAYAPAALH